MFHYNFIFIFLHIMKTLSLSLRAHMDALREMPPTATMTHRDFPFFCLSFSPQILSGNTNTYSEVENVLQPIIFASKIRIYPYSQYDRTVCLRAEIIGCEWDGKFKGKGSVLLCHTWMFWRRISRSKTF